MIVDEIFIFVTKTNELVWLPYHRRGRYPLQRRGGAESRLFAPAPGIGFVVFQQPEGSQLVDDVGDRGEGAGRMAIALTSGVPFLVTGVADPELGKFLGQEECLQENKIRLLSGFGVVGLSGQRGGR